MGHRFLTTNQLLLVPCLLSGKQDNRKTKSALKATQMKADAKRGALGIRVSATPPSLPLLHLSQCCCSTFPLSAAVRSASSGRNVPTLLRRPAVLSACPVTWRCCPDFQSGKQCGSKRGSSSPWAALSPSDCWALASQRGSWSHGLPLNESQSDGSQRERLRTHLISSGGIQFNKRFLFMRSSSGRGGGGQKK